MGKVTLEPITAEAIRKANERAAAITNAPTAIMKAGVERVSDRFHIWFAFRDGSQLSVPVTRIGELAGATEDALRTLVIAPSRDTVSFAPLDVDIYVPGLLTELYGSAILAEQGRAGGRRSSAAKARAVQQNGRKGGRPKKSA